MKPLSIINHKGLNSQRVFSLEQCLIIVHILGQGPHVASHIKALGPDTFYLVKMYMRVSLNTLYELGPMSVIKFPYWFEVHKTAHSIQTR